MAKKLIVKQVKSKIGVKPKHRATLWALGLRKLNDERMHDDTPAVRGMINQIGYLLEVKEINQ
ncbi:MAG: 50S ribosomal protein L30 [Spirochaetes bacterium]|jgi:large subunit ribosomal protein L30|nr:50S ribosomal protein L30 [Spirochaetota bacterium]